MAGPYVEMMEHNGLTRLVLRGTTEIARTPKGTPLDGGGHKDAARAERQMGYINAGIESKLARED